MEDWDVKTFRTDHGQAGVGVTENKNRVRLDFHHQLVGLCNDIAHGFAEVCTDCVEIHLRIGKFQVLEEHAVEVVVVVLTSMGEDDVEILTAFGDHGRLADDFRTGANDNQELQFAVVLKRCIEFHCYANLIFTLCEI